MQKIYIFDLDGTLIDSMPIFSGVVLGFLDKNGISYPNDIVATLTPLGYIGAAQYISDCLSGGYSAEEVYGCFQVETLRLYGETIPLKANVKETLERLKDAEKADAYRITGELLTANLYRLDKGMTEVELENWYSDNCEPIKISLDSTLSPSKNAQKYFKTYNKYKRAWRSAWCNFYLAWGKPHFVYSINLLYHRN